MSDGPFLRFFCYVTPIAFEDKNNFSDLSFAYFQALRKTGTPIRVLACNMGAFITEGRWSEFNEEFLRSVPSKYINVICGENGELVRLFTLGAPNIAITASYNGKPTPAEVKALQKFDAVICPSEKEAEIYRVLGVTAEYLSPDPAMLAALLRKYI